MSDLRISKRRRCQQRCPYSSTGLGVSGLLWLARKASERRCRPTFRSDRLMAACRGEADITIASVYDLGCVKTCPREQRAELFSLLSFLDSAHQHCYFLIYKNRDKLSIRKFNFGVFTQPRPEADSPRRQLTHCERFIGP